MKHFRHCPGNPTSYELIYGEYTDANYGTAMCSITWLERGHAGRTYVWPKGDRIFASYALEKTDINQADLVGMLASVMQRYPGVIKKLCGFEDYGYDPNTAEYVGRG